MMRLKFDSMQPARIEVTFWPGDEIECSGQLADQLSRFVNFRDPADVPEPAPQVVLDANGEVDYDASPPEALAVLGLTAPEKEPSVSEKSAKADLVAYADASGIDLGDATTKAEIVAVLFG
jgi:hypothetical protein